MGHTELLERQDIYCPQKVWDRGRVILKSKDDLSKPVLGQFCRPLLCGHKKTGP